MQPIEFDTQIVNGTLIVPPGVLGDSTGNVHVSVSVPTLETRDGRPSFIEELMDNPIPLQDSQRFNRDELYDR